MKINMTTTLNTSLDAVFKDMVTAENKARRKAASHIRKKIRRKAINRKKTGNLALGTYAKNGQGASFIGLRTPAYHAYLIEFDHLARDGSTVKAEPIVYLTFAEEAAEVERIMSQEWF